MSSTATDSNTFYAGKSSALLMPNRYKDHPVEVKRNHVGVYILVHGVNDVGVSFPAQDTGLCAGLNDRLGRGDLFPNDFRLPKEGDKVVKDPDAVYYQRVANPKTNSPVIHFHWGYRASKDDVSKKRKSGQVVDLYGNRLDERKAKMGGMFSNATSNIPDMFKGHYKGQGSLLANAVMDDAHIIATCPDRKYMALAAKRLAALITQIRTIDRNETITLIAHSQGCLISLCAQAFLKEDGGKLGYADCLIMNHPPYGLHEPLLEYADIGSEQQTTEARVQTLVNLVTLITGNPHPLPAFDTLVHTNPKSLGRTGPDWSTASSKRPAPKDSDSSKLAFNERDNRGKVYLYFCPHDMTVGLLNVQGIGTLGVPDKLEVKKFTSYSADTPTLPAVLGAGTSYSPETASVLSRKVNHPAKTLPVLSQLGNRFKQRVWTWRERGQAGLVGGATGPVSLRKEGEPDWASGGFARVSIDVGESRQVTGELLNPPWKPNLHHGENSGAAAEPNRALSKKAKGPEYVGMQTIDPIDATDAVVKGGIGKAMNADYARQHYQDKGTFENSYHSSIVANPDHSRWVTAMDVAIGQAHCMDDPEWRELLLAIADWRTSIDQLKIKSPKYKLLDSSVRTLVEATNEYYWNGNFPSSLVPTTPPKLVVSQTLRQRESGGKA